MPARRFFADPRTERARRWGGWSTWGARGWPGLHGGQALQGPARWLLRCSLHHPPTKEGVCEGPAWTAGSAPLFWRLRLQTWPLSPHQPTGVQGEGWASQSDGLGLTLRIPGSPALLLSNSCTRARWGRAEERRAWSAKRGDCWCDFSGLNRTLFFLKEAQGLGSPAWPALSAGPSSEPPSLTRLWSPQSPAPSRPAAPTTLRAGLQGSTKSQLCTVCKEPESHIQLVPGLHFAQIDRLWGWCVHSLAHSPRPPGTTGLRPPAPAPFSRLGCGAQTPLGPAGSRPASLCARPGLSSIPVRRVKNNALIETQ